MCASAFTPIFGRTVPRVRCRRSGWLTAPAHGAVSVKRGTLKATNLKQCLGIEVPAFVAFYRAAEDFNGADEFELEIAFVGGRKRLQHFRVEVSTKPGAGQGI